jgi:tetratricopeptide (TPR) repeat protein
MTQSFASSIKSAISLVIVASATLGAVDQSRLDAARELYRDRSKSAEAQSAYEAIAREDAGNAQAQFHLGLLALRRDDTEKAITHLERAVQLAPRDPDSHKALGDAYGRSAQKASIFKQLGFAKKCLAQYQRAAEIAPDRVEFHSSLFDYYSQAPGFAGGGFEKASATAATMKKLDPDRGRAAFATLYVREKKFEEAFAQYDEVLKSNPDDFSALYHTGRLAAITGQFIDRGLTSLRRCLELTPPPAPNSPKHTHVQWRLGQLLEKTGQKPAARTAYEAALKLDPTFAAAADALKKLH